MGMVSAPLFLTLSAAFRTELLRTARIGTNQRPVRPTELRDRKPLAAGAGHLRVDLPERAILATPHAFTEDTASVNPLE